MIKGLCFFCLAVFISCNQANNKSDDHIISGNKCSVNNNKEGQMQNWQSFKLDSVNIHVVFFTRPILEATYTLQGHCININSISVDEEFSKEVCERKTVHKIERYISLFYISKEDNIVLNRTKRDYIESTDYPYIKVVGYQNKKEVFNVNTQIGDEEYDIEYHPDFIDFYEFLDSLVKEK